ncbi:RNA polymerase sigma factor [Capillimicrobium parvum]|uniref:RNA polymerase sigma factor n=1 Tax=Capillimicrobium parvum TaxID=2884022 RepID=UPI00216AE36C|nr:sigma-70 family RNA polymerase sigma factor [Capillimicrobium parvum]
MGSDDDAALVAGVRAGDPAAFEAIFDRYGSVLLSFCRHMLGSREDAEDALQHVMLSAHRAMLASDRELHLRAWLFTIARNRCRSMLRARRPESSLEDAERWEGTDGLAAEVERREDLRAMLADLRGLPEQQRAALLLAELGAHSHEEIAEVLEVRPAKVKALVFQAREALAAARAARETPCSEIREQLATLRGSALRRRLLRRHVASCPGCQAFEAEVARQRAAIAVLLPVAPSAALKATVLGAAAVGGGGAAAGGGVVGGGLLVAAQSGTAKLLAVAVVAGVGGGGYVAITEHHRADRRAADPPAAASVRPAKDRVLASPVATRLAPQPVFTPGRRVAVAPAPRGTSGSSPARGVGRHPLGREPKPGAGSSGENAIANAPVHNGATNATRPVKPEKAKPVKPVKVKPVKPVKVKPVKPVRPVKVKAVKPVKPVKPVKVKAVKPVKPVEPVKVKPVKVRPNASNGPASVAPGQAKKADPVQAGAGSAGSAFHPGKAKKPDSAGSLAPGQAKEAAKTE